MIRRVLLVLSAVVLIGVIALVVIIRVVVFGGTPTIHRTANQPTVAASPCPTGATASGLRVFDITTSQSNASYEAHFLVAGQSVPGTVTGVTGDVTGGFLLTSDTQPNPAIMSMNIRVDLRTLDSGSSDRDDHVRNDTFQVNTYPYATFTTNNAQVIAGNYTEGQTVTFKLVGQLTMHGVTRPATFAMQGKLLQNTVTGSGSTLIHLQDYQMKTPAITSVVSITVSKDIMLMIQFTAQRQNCPN
jgi:polyisoprenoid-binding protein YceI